LLSEYDWGSIPPFDEISAVEAVAGSFAARAQLLVALSLFAGIVVLTDGGEGTDAWPSPPDNIK